MEQWIDSKQAAADTPHGGGIGKRVAVVASTLVLALAGGAAVGCGDDDNEGAAEEAGQAIDEAGSDAENAIEDADKEVGDDKD